METTEIKSKIRDIIAGMFDVKPSEVSDTKSFKDMAKYDSMRALEFLAKLENEFDVMIEPDFLQKMQSVEQSVQVIEELLRAK
ncbi:MAG TPA: acyl carrier protein [bacterium]|nr:acyl carrier protein [bacterium]